MGVQLYVGGHCAKVQGEVQDLAGKRMFTAAHKPERVIHAGAVEGLLDSGAFTDPPHKRLTPEQALDRQLAWEGVASDKWGMPFRAVGLVSYDLLIDETWIAGTRHKRRWDLRSADAAVRTTVEAAAYLASQRRRVAPRRLLLSAQGVDALHTPSAPQGCCNTPCRRIGSRSVAGASFSTAPILACTWKDQKKAGARHPHWRENVAWWVDTLANLRQSEYYEPPPVLPVTRQEVFL